MHTEFMELFTSLPEAEQRAWAIWFALHRDFPDLFPLPTTQVFEDPAAISLTRFLELTANEIAKRG